MDKKLTYPWFWGERQGMGGHWQMERQVGVSALTKPAYYKNVNASWLPSYKKTEFAFQIE